MLPWRYSFSSSIFFWLCLMPCHRVCVNVTLIYSSHHEALTKLYVMWCLLMKLAEGWDAKNKFSLLHRFIACFGEDTVSASVMMTWSPNALFYAIFMVWNKFSVGGRYFSWQIFPQLFRPNIKKRNHLPKPAKAQILGAWGLIDLDSSRIRMTEDLSSLIQSLELNALSSD